MRQSIRGYADGIIELSTSGRPAAPPAAPAGLAGPADPAVLADELRAVRGLIDSSEDLRRVLADAGVPVASRRAVLQDLLRSRVSATALQLISFAIEADRAADLPDDVSWLAARADAAARGATPAAEHVLGRRAAEERLDGYATAVLADVEGDAALSTTEDELFRFSQAVISSEDLRTALSDRSIPQSARQAVVEDLLRGKAAPATIRLAAYATRVGRPRDYQSLLVFLVDRVALEHDRRLADVRAPIDMDESQRAHLAEALSRLVGRSVDVRVTVDPAVLGGFVATIGDTVVDGSARHRLEILRERLVLPEATLTSIGTPTGTTGDT